MTTLARFALPAVVVLCVHAAPAAADRFDLSVGSTSRWMHDSSIDTLTNDGSNAAFSLGAGYKLARLLLPGLDLYLEAGLEHSSFGGTSFSRIESDVGITGGAVGARASYLIPHLQSRVAGFARASLGMSRVTLSLSDAQWRADPMKDWGWTSTGHLGGGFDLFAIRQQRTSGGFAALGIRLEVGYTKFGKVDLEAIPEHEGSDPDAITIPTAATTLGGLDVSAWTLNLGLVGRF